MKRLIQRDLCVLYLAEQGGWVKAVAMKGRPFKQYFLGSEADRRMQEVMEVVKEEGAYEINGYPYLIEEGSEGRFKTYRVTNPKAPRMVPHPLVPGRLISVAERLAL